MSAEVTSGATTRRSVVRSALRFVRNAVIGLSLLAAVPITLVITRGDTIVEASQNTLRERMVDADRYRPLMLDQDPSITPAVADVAFRAVQAKRTPHSAMRRGGVVPEPASALPPMTPHDRPWRASEGGTSPFENTLPRSSGPAASTLLFRAVEGFNAEELEWLRKVAEAPLWRDFDRVARASAIDVIGSQYLLPFSKDAFVLDLTIVPNYADTKELAYAGVSRAAYHLARGEHAQTKAALSAVVSYGFVLIDNAPNAMGAIIGRTVVDIGRAGFEQYYAATRTEIPAGVELDHRTFVWKPAERMGGSRDAETIRKQLIANADDATLSPGLRYESLRALSFASCGNVREMFTGPAADTRNAFARAGQTLARFPSERAYLDLLLEMTNRMPESRPGWIGRQAAVGAATVVGTVLNNPRVAACTRVLMVY